MEKIVLIRHSVSATALRLQVRARRIEMLAETAMSIAESYERSGRWPSALALIEAVLRDPDLPADRAALAARLRACQGRLLLIEALHETGDFTAPIAVLQEAAALALAAQDEQTSAQVRENLNHAYACQATLTGRDIAPPFQAGQS
jgi:hypothetical protein